MQVTLKIFRYKPSTDKKPHYDTYKLEAEPTDRVLDLLEYVKGNLDGTLSFRRSCAHGVCGSDAIRINGRNRLACKVLVKDIGSSRLVVEPILGLRVIKDLIVDMEPFFENYRSVIPYLVNDEPPPKQERLQSQEDRERFDAFAPAAPPPAPHSGPTINISVRLQSSPLTASSSIVATVPEPTA